MHQYVKAIHQTAESHAAQPAVIDCGGERRTDYRTLSDLSCRTAAWLLQKKLPEHAFLPIRLPSCMEFAAVEIGVWMAGYAAVPMGSAFPSGKSSASS